jgi:hypothetical protein
MREAGEVFADLYVVFVTTYIDPSQGISSTGFRNSSGVDWGDDRYDYTG